MVSGRQSGCIYKTVYDMISLCSNAVQSDHVEISQTNRVQFYIFLFLISSEKGALAKGSPPTLTPDEKGGKNQNGRAVSLKKNSHFAV